MKSDEMFEMLNGPAQDVAPRLLGCELIREVNGHALRGKIVETEAYDQTDAASHSYKGQTPRTSIMFGPAGFLYVYFTYGMHYCCNVVVGEAGYGAAVLIRAIEPIDGKEAMAENRQGQFGERSVQLTNGPAKLCQALLIDKQCNGANLRNSNIRLKINPAVEASKIIQTSRIGISRAKDMPWRFYLKGNPYVSKMA
jgi:DNA-3-methyladenine glycosylase